MFVKTHGVTPLTYLVISQLVASEHEALFQITTFLLVIKKSEIQFFI